MHGDARGFVITRANVDGDQSAVAICGQSADFRIRAHRKNWMSKGAQKETPGITQLRIWLNKEN
jgi:hypothetical protein